MYARQRRRGGAALGTALVLLTVRVCGWRLGVQHPVPVVVVTAAQETAVIGKDYVFFIAGDCRGEGFAVNNRSECRSPLVWPGA